MDKQERLSKLYKECIDELKKDGTCVAGLISIYESMGKWKRTN